ncbi:unnamed protein product [Clavelina lepadiformis]|uniref:Uncharacterized protein n=1 Tax=Clavelina lepadiformis TaxID=159417 RepID=A0ABP0G9A0_CLALP
MSSCIFEWDSGDLELLRQTKINELMQKTGVRMPSQAAVSKAIAKARPAWNQSQQRQDVLELSSQNQRHLCHDFKGGSFGRSFSPATDVFGVVILKEEIFEMRLKCDICTRLLAHFAVFPSRVISENDIDDVSS